MDSLELKEKIAQYFRKSVEISGNFNSGDPAMEEDFVEDALENTIAKEILTLIKKLSADAKIHRIIDLGCGLGGFLLACQKNGVSAIGVEIDPSAAEIARLRIADSQKVILGDCENLPFNDNSFDIAVSICVIEHVRNPSKYLFEARRVLKPDGRLILFAPNNLFPWEGHYKSFWLPYLLPHTKNIFKFFLKLKRREPRFIDFVNLKITPGFLKNELARAGFAKIHDLSAERFKERLANPALIADPKVKKALQTLKKLRLIEIFFKIFAPFLKISKLYHPIILIAQK